MADNPIKYFEPNHLEYGAEDLCLGIRLEICYMSRALNNSQVLKGDATINFLEGKDGYLTTSYTNITLQDIEDGGNKESIGIESINIKYNSWYFPEVSIKFIDIRGNALFNPMELTNNQETKTTAKGSFFKGFFTFPYPIFKLTVKGYFGLPITFNLTIKDIPKATFNSKTGNFELSVNFIGHLYSYLTDIPMTLLIVSPYIQYNGLNSNLGTFSNGVAIPTVPEFIKKTGLIIANFNQNPLLSKHIKKIEDANSNINNIQEIIVSLREIETILSKHFTEVERQGEKKIYKFLQGSLGGSDFSNYDDVINAIKDNLENIIKKYNKSTISNNLHILNNTPSTIDEIDEIYDNKEQMITLTYDYDSDIKRCNNMLQHFFEEIQKHDNKIKAEKEDVFYKNYGWKPTLKNIIEMFIGHLLKFNKNMELCLKDILDQSSIRNVKKLTCKTDIPDVHQDMTAYPFLRFLDKRNEILWIGDTEAKTYAERKLVDNIMLSSQKMVNNVNYSFYEYETLIQLSKLLPQGGIASLWYDIGGENPYLIKIREYNDIDNFCKPKSNGDIPEVFDFLAKRMVHAYLCNGNTECLKTFMPETEAINFLSTSYNIDTFSSSSFWGTENTNYISQFEDHVNKHVDKYVAEFKKNELNHSESTYDRTIKEEHSLPSPTQRITATSESLRRLTLTKDYWIEQYYFKKKVIGTKPKNSVWEMYVSEREFYVKLPNKLLDIKTEEEFNGYIDLYVSAINENGINDNDYLKVFNYAGSTSPNRTMGNFKNDLTRNIIVDDKYKQMTLKDGNYEFKDIDNWWGKVQDIGWFFMGEDSIETFSYLYSKGEEANFTIENPENADQVIRDFIDSMGFDITIENLCDFNVGGVCKVPLLSFLALGYLIKKERIKNIIFPRPDEWSSDLEDRIMEWFYNSGFSKMVLEKYLEMEISISRKILGAVRSPGNEAAEFIHDLGYGDKRRVFYCKLDKSALRDVKTIFTDNVFLFFPYKLEDGKLNFCRGDINVEGKNISYTLNEKIPVNAPDTVDRFINKIREYIFQPPQNEVSIGDRDRKIAIYDTLKNLYDKWKFGAENITPQNLNHKLITIDDFVFRNALNQDIGDSLNINIEKVIDLLMSIYKGETDMSLYNFLFEICSYVDCLLLSLPLNIFDATSSTDKLRKMFTPHPFNTIQNNSQGQTFIVTYRQKDSQHLNFGNNGEYKDDGIDFTNKNAISSITDTTFGAFGVTYGLNKQSIFKDIQVSMDKPIVTEQSIMSTLYIAEQGGKSGSNRIGYTYHDVFDTYSNHSYQCSVETLGNAQIMPMMYFQLNNVPLFKGGYFITAVEHNINNNGMTTRFTGNRINNEQFKLSQNSSLTLFNQDGITNDFPSSVVGNNEKKNSKVTNTVLSYTKNNTLFIINAGRIMTDEGFESPDLTKDDFMDIKYIKGKRDNNETDDILQPYDINGETTNRYREYWGNRKLATELVHELRKNEYKATYGGDNTKDSINRIKKHFQNDTKYRDNNIIIINLYTDSSSMEDVWLETNNFSFYASPDAISIKLSRMLFNTISIELRHTEIGDMTCNAFTVEKTEINNIDGFNNVIAPSVVGMNLNMQNKRHIKFLSKKENRQKIINGYIKGIEKFINAIEGKPIEISVPQKDSMMSKYFSYEDLTRTNKKIPNIPNEAEKQNLITLATTILDKVREKYGPIWVDSAFRSPEVNAAVGGVSNSQHLTGSAADIYAMDRVNNGPLFWAAYDLMQSGEITVGQLIWEYGNTTNPRWVHISLPNGSKINEVIRYYRNDDGKKCNKPFDIPHP